MFINIYTDGTYLKNNPDWGIRDSKWKAQIICDLLRKNNITPAEIIEIGCGAGGILKSISGEFENAKLIGYDISPQALEFAKRFENERLHFYNEDFLQKNNIHTDLLLMIDVLEHVEDYYNFLEDLKPKSEYFIFHIPLDLSCRTLLKPHVLLQQRDAVGHIHYFSKEMVLWALRDKGFTIIDWVYTKPIIDINKPGTFKARIKKILRNISFSFNKNMSAKLWGGYSMMILAK